MLKSKKAQFDIISNRVNNKEKEVTMANLQDLVKQYVLEAANNTDKHQAIKSAVNKIRAIRYSSQDNPIPKQHLLNELATIKASANDSHLEVIDAIMAELEAVNE